MPMMRRPLWMIPALLALCSPAPAAPSLSAEAGYRVDRFDWSIAGSDLSPDILSELSWDDLKIAELSVRGEFGPWGPVALRTEASYGYAFSGGVQDSDYLASGRRQEYSRSNNSADGSEFFDTRVALGFPLIRTNTSWRTQLTPLAGLSYQRQDLRLRKLVQTLSVDIPGNDPPDVGRYGGLDSRYSANWAGPWLGIELRSRHRQGFGLLLRADYHFWAAYWAKADWNLRTDLAHPVSFRHQADGHGLSLALGLEYAAPDSPWSWQLRTDWQRWRTGDGEDRVYLADGRIQGTRFNGAAWDSQSISLGGRYRF